jgi:catechol 2,3-dioxygenase-like lactoylglutathione lyase family enzyme
MSIDGLKFGHVAFKVADVERSVRWYGEAFGAR